MKKTCVSKHTLYGPELITILTAWVLIVFLSHGVSGETVQAGENAMVFEGEPNFIYNGTTNNVVVGSRWPQSNGLNHSRIYLHFADLTPRVDVALTCKTDSYSLGEGPIEELQGVKLFRFYRDESVTWNETLITWNNQPVYCTEEPDGNCWNSYGGIEYDYLYAIPPLSTTNLVTWNLTRQGMYLGGYEFDPYNIDLVMIQTNESATQTGSSNYIEFMGYTSNDKCYLSLTGDAVGNFSDVSLYAFDNYAGISGLEIQICDMDYEYCIYRTTNASGFAGFIIPFGNYMIDADYSQVGTPLIYSEQFIADNETESVSIYFNTLGPGSIGGYVYWPNGTGAPLAIVNVSGTNDYVTVTGLDGQFLISPIVKGNYTIQAFKAGLQSYKESFSCTGDDSINLDLQAGIAPPDGYAHTYVNITVFEGITTPLPGATVQRWSYGPYCPESCFADSTCRHTNCAGDRSIINFDDRITNVNGIAIMNHISSTSLPLPVQFYLYAFKSGYADGYRLVTVTGNYTPVSLYLNLPPNTTVNLHETNNLSGISLRVIPNMGASQIGVTNSSGDAQFTFTSVISSLIVNATTTNPSFMNKNFEFTSLAGNPINRDFTLPYRNATSFNLYGFCIDNVGNLVDGVKVELNCASCAGYLGDPTHCDEYNTQGGGLFTFTNIPKPPTSNCFVHATPPAGYALGDGWAKTFFPTPGDNFYNLTNCVRLIGENLTAGTITIEGNVIEGTGRLQAGLQISSGPFLYSINGSGYLDGMVSNGILYLDNLGEYSNVTIKFNIPNYEKRIFRIGLGNNHYTPTFTLNFIGIEETSTTEPTTTFPLVTTTAVTTTLVDWSNYTLYEPSPETIGLAENLYIIIITMASSICGVTTVGLTGITLFIGVCILLMANQVLKALGFKWEWLGF